jgi:hypothetical protein
MLTAAEQILVGLAQQILSQILGIAVGQQKQAVDRSPYGISDDVADLHAIQHNPTYSNAAIESLIVANQATLLTALTDIQTAVANTQQAGSAVTLPSTYPVGWSAGIGTDAAAGVWSYANPLGNLTTIQLLQAAGLWAAFEEGYGRQPRISPLFDTANYSEVGNSGWTVVYPNEDWTAIIAGDTMLSWLTRTNPGATVVDVQGYTEMVTPYGGSDPAAITHFVTSITESQFAVIMASMFPSVAQTAPVWPGLSGVTLGTPVALSNGLVVAGPLAGLLIDITAVAPPVSYYPFGAVKSFVRAGAVIFTTDNGDSEFPQPFGPEDEIITPKVMVTAASATLRVTTGIVGTVRPFTIP